MLSSPHLGVALSWWFNFGAKNVYLLLQRNRLFKEAKNENSATKASATAHLADFVSQTRARIHIHVHYDCKKMTDMFSQESHFLKTSESCEPHFIYTSQYVIMSLTDTANASRITAPA